MRVFYVALFLLAFAALAGYALYGSNVKRVPDAVEDATPADR